MTALDFDDGDDFVARQQHQFDRLDRIMEAQTFLVGASQPKAVALVDRFNDCAGYLERRMSLGLEVDLRELVGILREHRAQCAEVLQ